MKILVTTKGVIETSEDDYEKGMGDYVNSWDFDVRGEYDSAEDLIKAIKKETYLFDDYDIKDFSFYDGSITTSAIVDEDNMTADKRDIEEWKKGEKMLYIADMYLSLECVSDKHEMTDDEAEEFGFPLG